MVHYRSPRRGVRRSFIFFYSVLLLGCIQHFGDFREQDPLSDVDRSRQSLERYDPIDTPQKAGEDEWVQQKKEKQKKTRSVYEICRNERSFWKKELLIYLQDFRKLSTEAGLAVFTITAMVSSAAASSGLAVAA
jgi:hypothetical protein